MNVQAIDLALNVKLLDLNAAKMEGGGAVLLEYWLPNANEGPKQRGQGSQLQKILVVDKAGSTNQLINQIVMHCVTVIRM